MTPNYAIGQQLGWPPLGSDGLSGIVVFSGADGAELYRVLSPFSSVFVGFGQSVCAMGDIDLDGAGDFAIGKSNNAPCSGLFPREPGIAWIVSGGQGGSIIRRIPGARLHVYSGGPCFSNRGSQVATSNRTVLLLCPSLS